VDPIGSVRTPALTWPQVAAWRASRHHLDERVSRRRRIRVASELCGLHAQVMSSADLTMWARVDGWRPTDLAEALWKERALVKVWAVRGTLHLFPSSEHALWTAAIRTSPAVRGERWARYLGLSLRQMDRLIETIGEALEGRALTREELAAEVTRRRRDRSLGEAMRHSWGGLLKPASYRGLLCFAPSDGHHVRFTNPRTWLGVDGSAPDPSDALLEVTRRFVATYGPVPLDEIARWWSEGAVAGARRLMAALGDEVVEMEIDGAPAWAGADVAHRIGAFEPPRSVRLLPGFDQYVIGSTKHSVRLMPADHRARVHRQAGWVSPVLTVDGLLEGVWSWARKGTRLVVGIEPFRRQPAWVRRGAEAEAERLAGYLDADLDLTWS
jgi:Winged helix DNA-binding domain